MARTERYTAAQVAKALTEAKGFVSVAARALGCTDTTVRKYIARYPLCSQACADARESMVDMAEAKLFQLVQQGNVAAVIFTLKTLGKGRGFIEPGLQLRMDSELRSKGGDTVTTTVTLADWRKLAEERLAQADEAVSILYDSNDGAQDG